MTLPPGNYQLHVAARETGRGASGSVICDVVVPDLSVRGLAMTPLIVSTSRARRVPSANRDDQLVRALGGGPPTTARVFHRDETLSAYAEVVDVGAAAVRDVELVTIVTDARDREVVHSSRPNAAQRAEPGHSFPYAVDIPLRALAPGRYTLRVEARAAGAAEPVVRELRFEVAAPVRLACAARRHRMRPMPSRASVVGFALAAGLARLRPDARRPPAWCRPRSGRRRGRARAAAGRPQAHRGLGAGAQGRHAAAAPASRRRRRPTPSCCSTARTSTSG